MPGRTNPFQTSVSGMSDGSDSYRYGFNGKENDFEPKNGQGTQQDYGFRIYDPRLGKFFSVDPLTKSYPWYTPYQFSGNTPIQAIDLDGLEEFAIVRWYDNGKYCGNTIIKVPENKRLEGHNTGVLIINLHNNDKPPSYLSSTDQYNATLNLIFYVNSDGNNSKFGGRILEQSKNKWENKEIEKLKLSDRKIAKGEYPDRPVFFGEANNSENPINPEIMAPFINELKDNPEFQLEIEGNASKSDGGNEQNNITLSEKRAKTVKETIVRAGGDSSKIKTRGNGSSRSTINENPDDRNAIIKTTIPKNDDYR